MMRDPVFLIFVDGKDGTNSNKFYNMKESGGQLVCDWGRVGSTKSTSYYPLSRWDSLHKSKVKKGYEDVTSLREVKKVATKSSGNADFENFLDIFGKYLSTSISKTYLVESCTDKQLQSAQKLINSLVKSRTLDRSNKLLLDLFKTIPRKMGKVQDFLLKANKDKRIIIAREQDALDSMDSNNVTSVEDPFAELNIDFKQVDCPKSLAKLITSTSGGRCKIQKCFEIKDKSRISEFENEIEEISHSSECSFLIHGTRNPNILSILKTGLRIRPSNAACISGANYGNGIYHSQHAAKSLNYTGYDTDKVFFIQRVNMGKPFTYDGWYRDGKSISTRDMNRKNLLKMGYDSVHVNAGDGLLNDESIVYSENQTITNYLLHLK